MPPTQTIQERTLYQDIVEYLRKQSFKAIGETQIEGNKSPDITCEFENLKFLIEVKIDDVKIGLSAVAQVMRYAQTLKTNNVIVLIYPKKLKGEMIFSQESLAEIVLTTPLYAFISTDIWIENIEKITFVDLVSRLKTKLLTKERDIDFNTVVKRINEYVTDFNAAIHKVNKIELTNEVVKKLDLFSSIGDIKDKTTAEKQVLNLASFLLFNQLLFYHIFSKKNQENVIPELEEIQRLMDVQKYFDKILDIDYKSIYRVNILGHISDERFMIDMLNDVIVAIKSLRAEHITHDLAGRFFHDLIPFQVRKVLAAFYTNPNAADLLAGLLIDSYDNTVIDPTCGSGTLLVAAYKQKEQLYKKVYGYSQRKEMHKAFIENDITGIDIMPFAAHIATINLTMQNIDEVTNNVRFATSDSLDLARNLTRSTFAKENSGIDVEAYTETIQGVLFDVAEQEKIRMAIYEEKKISKGALSANGENGGFKLFPSDVAIMNPPFSDREKMPKFMQEKLNENVILNSACGNLVNLWGYFLVLGNLLIKDNGKMGAVIPINFARGQATEKVRDFILKNHHIQYIIKPVGDMAFSEGAAFKDILLITEKRKPTANDKTKIVYIKKSIREFKDDEFKELFFQIKKSNALDSDIVDIFTVGYQDLLKNQNNLMYFLWATSYRNFQTVHNLLHPKIWERMRTIPFPENFVRDCFNSAGFKGLIDATFITNPMKEKSRIERAFMVLENEKGNDLTVRLRGLGDVSPHFKVPKKVVKKALRTITGVRTMEIGKKHDYFIESDFKEFKQIKSLPSKIKKDFDWKAVQKRVEGKFVHLGFSRRFNIYSPNTSFIAFYSNEPMNFADTFKIVPNVTKEQAKILCLFYNSIFNIVQVLVHREATTGNYGTIRETDLLQFKLLDYKNLSDEEKKLLLDTFKKIRKVKFPSVVEQIENRFPARVEMDMAILQVIGYQKNYINKLLPELYETVLTELKHEFKM
jgi:hypothetical protein